MGGGMGMVWYTEKNTTATTTVTTGIQQQYDKKITAIVNFNYCRHIFMVRVNC